MYLAMNFCTKCMLLHISYNGRCLGSVHISLMVCFIVVYVIHWWFQKINSFPDHYNNCLFYDRERECPGWYEYENWTAFLVHFSLIEFHWTLQGNTFYLVNMKGNWVQFSFTWPLSYSNLILQPPKILVWTFYFPTFFQNWLTPDDLSTVLCPSWSLGGYFLSHGWSAYL